MNYRKFENLNLEISNLGLGAMRFPTTDDGEIKEAETIDMIRYAIDNGVNYVDTAWPYHDGESEKIVGKALQDGYRDKTYLATKLPSWLINERSDMDKYLNKQLERLETEQIDFYLLHSLNQKFWSNYKKLDVFSWLKKIKQEGKVKYIGFSFHDNLDLFKEIIDSYDGWDFCQIQYNYLDTEFQAGAAGLRYAASKNIPVIAMEPLKGGKLADKKPPIITEKITASNINTSAVELALKWLWNQEEVSLVLSGMSTLEQVKENVELASKASKNCLNTAEADLVGQIKTEYQKLSPVECTGCDYCVICPQDIPIKQIFSLYNEAKIYDDTKKFKEKYNGLENNINDCISCEKCQDICPQNLAIIDSLAKANNYFL